MLKQELKLTIYLKRFLDHQPPSVRVYSDITRGEAYDHNMGPGTGALPTNVLQSSFTSLVVIVYLLLPDEMRGRLTRQVISSDSVTETLP